MTIIEVSPEAGEAHEAGLSELLIDAVDSGASIGFLPPVAQTDARQYWHTVFDSVRSGTRVLLAAEDRDRIVGSAQLGLESRANGRHRAEVMKLMVHRTARGKGIGRALMAPWKRRRETEALHCSYLIPVVKMYRSGYIRSWDIRGRVQQ